MNKLSIFLVILGLLLSGPVEAARKRGAPETESGKAAPVSTPVRRATASSAAAAASSSGQTPPTVDVGVETDSPNSAKVSTESSSSRRSPKVFARATIDAAFKHIFGTDDTSIILSFLRAVTNLDIVTVRRYSVSVPPLKERVEDKQTFLDLACQDQKGNYFLAEVQVKAQDFWNKRALYYGAGIYARQLEQGDPWRQLAPVFAINLLDHDRQTLPPGKFKRHFCMTDVDNPAPVGNILDLKNEEDGDIRRGIHIIQIELPRVPLETLPEGPLRQWLQLFKQSQDFPDVPENVTDEAVRKAYDLLKFQKWGDKLKRDYEQEELQLEDYSRVLALQRAEGLEEGKRQMIRSMQKKMSLREISEMLEISVAEVEGLLAAPEAVGDMAASSSSGATAAVAASSHSH